ncbi:MAG TPA: hypothetical protein VN920_00830 [Pyrinomonadaceae bacterium]|nr:hypothetical protein [Pyrinomonadaceae bacterium]
MKFTKAGQQYYREFDSRIHRAKLSLKRDGFSNGREEQILARYIAEFLPTGHNRTAVDIGAGDGMRWSNTYALFLNGWKGVGIEFDGRKFVKLARAYKYFPDVYASRNRATPNNIVPLLQSYETPADFAVLSLDIDGNDYWVLRAILSVFRPQLIVTEINEKIPPPIRFVVKYDPDFQLRHHFFGYSMAVLADLCEEFGYVILTLEYNNAFLAPKELAGERAVEAQTAYGAGYLNRPDRKEKFSLNFDMETIYSLNAEDAVEFLRKFYSKFAGEFYLGLNELFMTEGLNGEAPHD